VASIGVRDRTSHGRDGDGEGMGDMGGVGAGRGGAPARSRRVERRLRRAPVSDPLTPSLFSSG
jgi:hypothetical protein